MVTALSLSVIAAFQAAFPVGSYKADVSKAPAKTRGLLEGYFGKTYLVVRSDGRFFLCGIEQDGYWRKSGDKFVFIYDGFFRLKSGKPAEVLLKAWPRNHLEGMILRKGTRGTLTLSDFGTAAGPVIFRPMPRRTMAQLIVASDVQGESTPRSTEAWYSFREQMQAEWPEVLSYINNPKPSWESKIWAAILLQTLKDPKGIEKTAQLIISAKPSNTKNRDYALRRALARVVAQNPTEKAADLLIHAERRGLLRPYDVAPALGRLGRKTDILVMLPWLDSKEEWDKSNTLEALTILEAEEALDKARNLTNDPKERVQLTAFGLIARISADPFERKEAVAKLSSWPKSSDMLLPSAAMEALVRSKSPDALPYLVAILSSDSPTWHRRNTAEALGDFGDLRAVPALIEARSRPLKDTDDLVEEAGVGRAITAALAQLGKLKRSVG